METDTPHYYFRLCHSVFEFFLTTETTWTGTEWDGLDQSRVSFSYTPGNSEWVWMMIDLPREMSNSVAQATNTYYRENFASDFESSDSSSDDEESTPSPIHSGIGEEVTSPTQTFQGSDMEQNSDMSDIESVVPSPNDYRDVMVRLHYPNDQLRFYTAAEIIQYNEETNDE
eukprot:752302-Hanusia_phi.AAC.1